MLMSQVNGSCWNLDFLLFTWLEFFSWGVCDFHSQSSSFLKIFVAKFVQATSHFWPTTERCHSERVRAAIRKLNVVEDNTVQMVCILRSAFPFSFSSFVLFVDSCLDSMNYFMISELLIFTCLRMLNNFASSKLYFNMVICKFSTFWGFMRKF